MGDPMAQTRIATHVAAAVIGAAIAILSVRTCRQSSSPSSRAPVGQNSGAPVASASATADAGPQRTIPIITRFNVPNPAVNVTQRENGTLEVVNSDPKLAGTQLSIEGITAEGKVLTFDVRVPAPRKSP
jgi:hypothetical protein